MHLRWLISPAYRAAHSAWHRQARLLASRRDDLAPEGVAAVLAGLSALEEAMRDGHSGRLRIKTEELQFAVNQWISPYHRRTSRMVVEILMVALVLALTIRTFFAQPFNIPTGSMEPTLYGVNHVDLRNNPQIADPTGWGRFWAWFQGYTYVESMAEANGMVDRIDQVKQFLGINLWQFYWIGGVRERVWFPGDVGDDRSGIGPLIRPRGFFTMIYRVGDKVIDERFQCGDFLLADRLTYNFRKPGRGEIVVFKTQGITEEQRERFSIPAGEFYLKRLVGLPGEKVQIGDDRHLIIDGHRLDATTPHFAKVYGFNPRQVPARQKYSGHLNGATIEHYHVHADFTPMFPDAQTSYTDEPGSYLVMGDNTVDSLDSRYWGAITQEAIIGRCWFVFWPLTERFGWQPDR